jgi:hypothetical protein
LNLETDVHDRHEYARRGMCSSISLDDDPMLRLAAEPVLEKLASDVFRLAISRLHSAESSCNKNSSIERAANHL